MTTIQERHNQLTGHRLVAIDPGETCGVAVISPLYGDLLSFTMEQRACEDWFNNFARFNSFYLAIIEEYRVYPDKALTHSGKTIPTAECVGALKYIARSCGMMVVEQQASIKKPTAGMLAGRGIELIGTSRHAKDAELHLWHRVLRSEYNN